MKTTLAVYCASLIAALPMSTAILRMEQMGIDNITTSGEQREEKYRSLGVDEQDRIYFCKRGSYAFIYQALIVVESWNSDNDCKFNMTNN